MSLEKIDIKELMEVKGGNADGDIHCDGAAAVSCNAPNSGVINSGGHKEMN